MLSLYPNGYGFKSTFEAVTVTLVLDGLASVDRLPLPVLRPAVDEAGVGADHLALARHAPRPARPLLGPPAQEAWQPGTWRVPVLPDTRAHVVPGLSAEEGGPGVEPLGRGEVVLTAVPAHIAQSGCCSAAVLQATGHLA